MDNWRDRTERDAMLHHRNVITPDSIKLRKTNDKKALGISWQYLSTLAFVISAGLMLTSLLLFLLSRNSTISSQPETIDSYRILFICEKNSKGNSVINITDIDGGNKRPLILIKSNFDGDSEARCEKVAVDFNKRIKAERENMPDTINTEQYKLQSPSLDSNPKKDRPKKG